MATFEIEQAPKSENSCIGISNGVDGVRNWKRSYRTVHHKHTDRFVVPSIPTVWAYTRCVTSALNAPVQTGTILHTSGIVTRDAFERDESV